MRSFRPFFIVAISLCVAACSRSPLERPSEALRPAEPVSVLDDLSPESLAEVLERQIGWWKRTSAPAFVTFGPKKVETARYIASLEALLDKAKNSPSGLGVYLARWFELYEVYGDKEWGDVFITSYFEPMIDGAREPSGAFTQPLYKAPSDLLVLNLGAFGEKFAGERALRARIDGNKVLPYYSRREIDRNNALAGRGLELCWVDPIDAFFLQIQGSGTVRFGDSTELTLGYAEKNGQPYEAVGRFVKDKIPGGVTLATLEAYLRSLDAQALGSILDMNPSYVFFTQRTEHAVTSIGVPATAGRTIATDRKYFPKGALALLEFDKPEDDGTPATVRRLVVDQDVGGAITGPGRVDLFWGRGKDAGRRAGEVKTHGRLWYLVPK